jgi:hypothetical protein
MDIQILPSSLDHGLTEDEIKEVFLSSLHEYEGIKAKRKDIQRIKRAIEWAQYRTKKTSIPRLLVLKQSKP